MQGARFVVAPLHFLEGEWRRSGGDVFSIRYPFFDRIVYVVDGDAIKSIFTGDPDRFHAGEGNAGPLEPVLGQHSLLTLDGAPHMEHRRLLLPPFHGERIARYAEVMREAAVEEIERWPVGKPFALRLATQRITLEVILRAVFGVREEERLRRFRELIPQFGGAENMFVWIPALRRDFGPWKPWSNFRRLRGAVDDLIYEEIAERRADPRAGERDDVLSMLVGARHEDGSPMSDLELRDELMTLLAAGHETTATGLAWLFERVLRHPGVERRLGEAVAAGDEGEPYIDAVVKETLRVRPVVVDVVRRLTADTEIAGYVVPRGTYVVPAVALVHLRPDLYEQPRRFMPERWLDGAAAPGPYSWIPFGGGVRRCIGAAFAQYEIKAVVREIVSRVRLRAPDARPESPRTRHVTMVPSRGCRVVVERRL